ncbi:hypothetical protein, partial [Tenacibaculum maritimum]|uniref:hypothetical protein n=3 Tax=Tenacibaculum maritimum TaxID=107401 RepID=UPI003876C6FF
NIIHISLILIILNCKAQNISKMKQEIIIPEITNEFEKFDIKKYTSEKENYFLEENELLVKRMSQSFGYGKHIIYPNSYFSITKLFYKNNNIKEKGISFNNGSEYGVWHEFDENGKLIKTINTDEDYGFDWKAVILYCEKNKIPLTKGFKEFDGFQTRIFKNEIDNRKLWEITCQISGDELLKITLDGETGKELKKEKLEFVNH